MSEHLTREQVESVLTHARGDIPIADLARTALHHMDRADAAEAERDRVQACFDGDDLNDIARLIAERDEARADAVRMAQEVLRQHQHRSIDYMLRCPSANCRDARAVIVKYAGSTT